MKTYIKNCDYDCPHCLELRNCDWAFYNITKEQKVSEKKKSDIINWINFSITVIGILGKVIKEIIEVLPKGGTNE